MRPHNHQRMLVPLSTENPFEVQLIAIEVNTAPIPSPGSTSEGSAAKHSLDTTYVPQSVRLSEHQADLIKEELEPHGCCQRRCQRNTTAAALVSS